MSGDPLPTDQARLERERIRALLSGRDDWGIVGTDKDARYVETTKSLKMCRCGCRTRITHVGMANGIPLISGCEFHVKRWVRNR